MSVYMVGNPEPVAVIARPVFYVPGKARVMAATPFKRRNVGRHRA